MIQALQRQKEEVKNVTSYSYQGRATNHHFFLWLIKFEDELNENVIKKGYCHYTSFDTMIRIRGIHPRDVAQHRIQIRRRRCTDSGNVVHNGKSSEMSITPADAHNGQ